jgi:hypothetical protein
MSRGGRRKDNLMDNNTYEKKINLEELQILLNMMGKRIIIQYPLYNFNFLTARIVGDGYHLEINCLDKDFDKQLSRFGNSAKELPSYSDFRGGLISSGVLKFKNIDDLKEKLKVYSNLNKEVKYSLDTNLLYFRFLTNYLLMKPSEIVLVKTVGDEIKSRLNHKYNPQLLSSIKHRAKFQKQLLSELWNRRRKRSRKAAYIALREYKMILEGVADELDEHKLSLGEHRDNDMVIVKTLSELEKEGYILPVLFTADDAMADLCNAEGLEYFKLDIPHAVEAKSCTVKELLGLIFNYSVVFGFIKINSVIVFGEFRGKSTNKPDELKLEFYDKKLYNDFVRDLKICRRLMELGIDD